VARDDVIGFVLSPVEPLEHLDVIRKTDAAVRKRVPLGVQAGPTQRVGEDRQVDV
jgi:hypothetical protein